MSKYLLIALMFVSGVCGAKTITVCDFCGKEIDTSYELNFWDKKPIEGNRFIYMEDYHRYELCKNCSLKLKSFIEKEIKYYEKNFSVNPRFDWINGSR